MARLNRIRILFVLGLHKIFSLHIFSQSPYTVSLHIFTFSAPVFSSLALLLPTTAYPVYLPELSGISDVLNLFRDLDARMDPALLLLKTSASYGKGRTTCKNHKYSLNMFFLSYSLRTVLNSFLWFYNLSVDCSSHDTYNRCQPFLYPPFRNVPHPKWETTGKHSRHFLFPDFIFPATHSSSEYEQLLSSVVCMASVTLLSNVQAMASVMQLSIWP